MGKEERGAFIEKYSGRLKEYGSDYVAAMMAAETRIRLGTGMDEDRKCIKAIAEELNRVGYFTLDEGHIIPEVENVLNTCKIQQRNVYEPYFVSSMNVMAGSESDRLVFNTYKHVGKRVEYQHEGVQIFNERRISVCIVRSQSIGSALNILNGREKYERALRNIASYSDIEDKLTYGMIAVYKIMPESSCNIGCFGVLVLRPVKNKNTVSALLSLNYEEMIKHYVNIGGAISKMTKVIETMAANIFYDGCGVADITLRNNTYDMKEKQRKVLNGMQQEIAKFESIKHD